MPSKTAAAKLYKHWRIERVTESKNVTINLKITCRMMGIKVLCALLKDKHKALKLGNIRLFLKH